MFPPYYMLHRTLLLITVKSNFHAADYHSYKMQDKQEENLMRPEISWIRKGKCHAQAHGMRPKISAFPAKDYLWAIGWMSYYFQRETPSQGYTIPLDFWFLPILFCPCLSFSFHRLQGLDSPLQTVCNNCQDCRDHVNLKALIKSAWPSMLFSRLL